jgi:TIR domain
VLRGTLWPFRIFVCYRREDSAAEAGGLYSDLASKFGAKKVFFDVDANIPLASNFEEHISKFIGQSDAFVAVIGEHWLVDKSGRRRLDNEDDYVRREIEMALDRGVPVFQAYVQSPDAPPESDLPESLKQLAKLEGQPLIHRSWRQDTRKLIHELKGVRTRKFRYSRRWFAVFGSVAVVAVLSAIAIAAPVVMRDGGSGGQTSGSGGQTTTTPLFEDNFSSQEQDWRDVAEQTGGSYVDGAYLIEAEKIDPQEENRVGVIVSPANAPTAENVRIDVEAGVTGGTAVTSGAGYAYGIVCRASEDLDDLYRFTYWPGGPSVHIHRRLDGVWTGLKEKNLRDVGHAPEQQAELQAQCVTTPEGAVELEFVVNGERTTKTDFEALEAGAVGLTALLGPKTALGETLEVQFDDFAVNEVEAPKR